MGFDWDTSNLESDYVDREIQNEMITKAVTGAPSMQVMRFVTGIKHKQELQTLDTDVTYVDASTCLDTDLATGDTTPGKFELAVAPIGIIQKFCSRDLDSTEFNQILAAGTNNETEDLPLQQAIINYMIEKHRFEMEKLIWRGNTASSGTNLQFFDGFKTKFDASGSVVELNTDSIGSITSSNAFNALYQAVENFEDLVGEGIVDSGRLIGFVDRSVWQKLRKNMIDNNYFVERLDDDRYNIRIDGTDIVIRVATGLNVSGEQNIYFGDREHFTVGTDLESDFEDLDVFYSREKDAIFFRLAFRLGVEVPFYDQIGKWTPGS